MATPYSPAESEFEKRIIWNLNSLDLIEPKDKYCAAYFHNDEGHVYVFKVKHEMLYPMITHVDGRSCPE